MNINQVSRSLEIYQNAISTKPVQQAKKPVSKGNDTMTLSETAKDFRTVMDALKNVPDIREDKVGQLRDRVSSNNYEVSADDISERILKSNFDALG